MNRDQKAAVIEEIAAEIQQAEAIYAVDYRGISVPDAAELRTSLRDAGASFRIVKNTLTERAADQADVAALKELLEGPTALTFVRGDAALAAKALSDHARRTDTLAFKGGFLSGAPLSAADIGALARLPGREVLYGQLVGVVASPLTGLVRGLGSLIGGLAIALGQVQERKQSGEIPARNAPAAVAGVAPAADEGAPTPDEGAPAAEEGASANEEGAPAAEEGASANEEGAPAAEEGGSANEAVAPTAEEGGAPAAEQSDGDQDAEAPVPAPTTDEPAEGADDDTAPEA